jgi:hypothetical protein
VDIELIRARVSTPTNSTRQAGDGTHEERKLAHAAQGRTVRPAAVLILLQQHASNELHVVLTQRTAHLHDHAGQISFPGGRKDDDDANLIESALRETRRASP